MESNLGVVPLRYYERRSQKAIWSYRIAAVAVLVFVGAFVWHRFFGLPTPLAFKIIGGTVLVPVVTLPLAVGALVNIWNEGCLGAGRATFALFLSLLLLALPVWSLPKLIELPKIYDVSTDTASPPAFDRIAKIRQGQANPVHYDQAFAPLQAKAYPDLKPLVVARSLVEVYSTVRDAAKALNWKIIDEQAAEGAKTGYIEAVDRTLLFGFTDDIAIRVTGTVKSARVDIRSSARFGEHDLGRNAERIRLFIAEVKSRLAVLERSERMERLTAPQEAAAKEKPKHRTRHGADSRDN